MIHRQVKLHFFSIYLSAGYAVNLFQFIPHDPAFGNGTKSIDGAARDIITEAGYGPYFGHSYGHSLGLEIHEAPNCTPRNENPIPAGAVCSAEPGIYIPGKFGVRIEDVVIFREGGCEVITHSPKELTIL